MIAPKTLLKSKLCFVAMHRSLQYGLIKAPQFLKIPKLKKQKTTLKGLRAKWKPFRIACWVLLYHACYNTAEWWMLHYCFWCSNFQKIWEGEGHYENWDFVLKWWDRYISCTSKSVAVGEWWVWFGGGLWDRPLLRPSWSTTNWRVRKLKAKLYGLDHLWLRV